MKWSTEGTAYTYDFDRFEIGMLQAKILLLNLYRLRQGNSIWVAGPDQTIGPTEAGPDQILETSDDGTSDDPVDRGVKGTFDGGLDDWPKDKNGNPSNETVWWENDSIYDNKSRYISQLGLGSSDGDESTPWNTGDDRTNFVFRNEGEVQTNPANALTTKLTLRVEADTIFQINATYTPLEEATNNKTIEGGTSSDVVLDAVGIGITLIDSSIDSVANARSSLGFLQRKSRVWQNSWAPSGLTCPN